MAGQVFEFRSEQFGVNERSFDFCVSGFGVEFTVSGSVLVFGVSGVGSRRYHPLAAAASEAALEVLWFSRANSCFPGLGIRVLGSAAEREGNNLKGVNDVCLRNGSNQGHNLALTV